MKNFFAPTRFEVPLNMQTQVSAFGIGQRSAERLAHQLNKCLAKEIIVFGCAGAVRPGLKAGDTFVIREIVIEGRVIQMPERYRAPSARLFTSPKIVSKPENKMDIAEKTGADIVDMEMGFLWEAASSSVKERLVFVRGVLDSHHDELKLNSVMTWTRLPRQLMAYHRGLKDFFGHHIFRR